ncbi:Scytalone dehydratase [Madurella fahalii]|uniref:Scytalone dehydratase n=1 Tax=Madurella fahalii TaxID=1157608 RepID=A0ABQ0GA36_9PEZI
MKPSFSAVGLFGATLFQHVASRAPRAPGLTYLGTANITLAPPIPVGPGPRGDRNIFAITGGIFSGPRLSGTIPGFGGDWGLGDPTAGNFYVDARYQIQTAEGANIMVEANGPQQPEGILHTRNRFETGHPDYYWLNNIVAIGIVQPGPDVKYIIVDLWKMESPVTKG